jgi:Arc/MetJ family transcription regulator
VRFLPIKAPVMRTHIKIDDELMSKAKQCSGGPMSPHTVCLAIDDAADRFTAVPSWRS